jgi:tetratricopeptide (TPR) repeat protein
MFPVLVLVSLVLFAMTLRAEAKQQPAASAIATRPAGAGQVPADAAVLERKLLDGVKQSPDSFEARHMLAVFYLREGNVKLALPHLERAAAINPSSYEVGYDLARVLLETGRLDAARSQVKQWLARKDVGELHNLLGDIEERAGNMTGAAAEYQRAAHMDPSEEHLFDWGDNLLQLRAYDPAAEVFRASIARHPESARLRVGLGIAQYSRGEYQDAVQSFCDAADLAPSDPRPYQFLGEMYGVSPEMAKEISTRLARFVETHPKNALAHFHYAMSLRKDSGEAAGPADLRRIEGLLTRAVQLDPRLAKGFFELGVLQAEQQRYNDAIESLRRATVLEPSLSQAHYRLALVYQRTGRKDLAAKELEAFRQLTGASGGDK